MKKSYLLIIILFNVILLTGCSTEVEHSLDSEDMADLAVVRNQDFGNGTFELLSNPISVDSKELEFITSEIDENKITYIYVADKEVFKQKIKNEQPYKFSIKDVENAHSTEYNPKVQLVQYEKDNDMNNFTTFKQRSYQVEK
ncbi:hypothetical protein [Candidatus Enterococcus ferrettii]|uniref:Lipoprotein n=1 Tax=Candidatus Enterococcus ferrettii TaxID=2815324 RepID=A0ABV0ELM9_9ENTE|nr:hypothetical protein [Enterococcus sp. 665A]MBO1342163.1 hypothetical protein [Enterococcus sp. 665A]